MSQPPLDLSGIFDLESHGADTFIGESPTYSWGRIYGGLVIAQGLWAAMQTVREEHLVHSLHAYFILGGDPKEPVRYEVDRVRNGRSFSTRRVVARQSAGAILTLGCSFQAPEDGHEVQTIGFPSDVPSPEDTKSEWDAGVDRRDGKRPAPDATAWTWARFPDPVADDPRLHACTLAYVSDLNPMGAIAASQGGPFSEEDWEKIMAVSLDHSIWFHRPISNNDWVLMDLEGRGMTGARGLAAGSAFTRDGTHVATIAQECLIRDKREPSA